MADSPPPISRLIDYEALALEAMRGIARRVLAQVAGEGLPGDHHFYIEFDTTAAGVKIPEFLRTRYPERMTIVLQHRFTGLKVTRQRFQVGLEFGGVPAALTVPFAAVTAFMDPAARFAVRFAPEVSKPEADAGAPEAPASPEPEDRPGRDAGVVSLDAYRARQGAPPADRRDGDSA